MPQDTALEHEQLGVMLQSQARFSQMKFQSVALYQ